MIFVNFKTYLQASGQNAVKLAEICQIVSLSSKIPIIPCVQAVDLSAVVKAVKTPVWVQHLDPVASGQHTGYVTAEAIKTCGGGGTLLNHSEHPLSFTDLKKAMSLARQTGIKTLVLVKDLASVKTVDELKPDYLGLEEPALIGGGKAMAVFKEERAKIVKFVQLVKYAVPIIGAGISTPEDIKQSLILGAKGVLVASAVVLAKNPKTVLQEMAKAF